MSTKPSVTNPKKRIAIIGGGASGLASAIAAGERARMKRLPVSISLFERDDRVGRSILVTGNGRCNFSNSALDVAQYRNGSFVRVAFDSLERSCGRDPVHGFFASCGLVWREEADGRQYPLANKASAVVDVLRFAAAREGVVERCDAQVKAVEPPREIGKSFTLRMADGVFERADAVVMACGGKGLQSLEAEGLRVLASQPVLGPLGVVPDDRAFTRELDNIRVKCDVSLMRPENGSTTCIASESGELMFRKYGVSGICVFNLSRLARQGDSLVVDFLGLGSAERAKRFVAERRDQLVKRYGERVTFEDMLRGIVLPRVADALLKRGHVKPRAVCDSSATGQIASMLQACSLEIQGVADSDLCQVRRGGFDVAGFDAATMQSKDIPNLFATGEALDVDGPCGGYNLHWAWASGLIAGAHAVEVLQ